MTRKYKGCVLRDHQAHALRCNFKKRHEHDRYRTMTRMTLAGALIDKAIARCKNLEPNVGAQ